MKKLLIIFLLMIQQHVVFADETADSLKNTLLKITSYQADFTQVVKDISGEILQEASGKILMQQPQKLYWETFEPNEAILVADGNTLWHLDPFVEQVIAMNQDGSTNNHPIMLIAEPERTNWEEYKVTQTNNGYSVFPISEQQSVRELELTLANGVITSILIKDQQDQVNELLFSNIKQNDTIEKSIFEFVVPEGFDLDDQR